MSTFYLIDLFTDKINSVETPPDNKVPVVGNYVVRVPQGVSVQAPTSLSDLLTKKYNGIFATHAGFANEIHDDLLDAAAINTVASTGCTLGFKGSISLYNGGVLQSTVSTLATSPTQVIVNFELFEHEDTDPATDRFSRSHKEVVSSSSNMTCQVSFDNGTNFLTVTEGSLSNIPNPSQGNQFIIKFTNVTSPPKRLFLGSWAMVY